MFRCRAAASTDEPHTGVYHATGVEGHVLGTRQINFPVTDRPRHSRVGLGRQRPVSDQGYPLYRVQHGCRANGAVKPNDLHIPLCECLSDRLDRRAVGCVAVLCSGHLGDYRQVGQLSDRLDSSTKLVDVTEGLENETVDPAFQQSGRLPPEVRHSLVACGRAKRLYADPERSDSADHTCLGARGSPRQRHRRNVDLLGLVLEPVARQLYRIGAKRVGLENLGTALYVLRVNALDQVGFLQVQFVVTDVDEHAAIVQHRAHGPVDHVDAPVCQQVGERSHVTRLRVHRRGWGRANALPRRERFPLGRRSPALDPFLSCPVRNRTRPDVRGTSRSPTRPATSHTLR